MYRMYVFDIQHCEDKTTPVNSKPEIKDGKIYH